MAYKCHNFCNGEVLLADPLNEMEQAIVAIEQAVMDESESRRASLDKMGLIHFAPYSITKNGVVTEVPISRSGTYKISAKFTSGYSDLYFYEIFSNGSNKAIEKYSTDDGIGARAEMSAGSKLRLYVASVSVSPNNIELMVTAENDSLIGDLNLKMEELKHSLYLPSVTIFNGDITSASIFTSKFVDGLVKGSTVFLDVKSAANVQFVVSFRKRGSTTNLQQTNLSGGYNEITLEDDYGGFVVYSAYAYTNVSIDFGFKYNNYLTKTIESLLNRRMSIIGDSWSTFNGFTNPTENRQWYPASVDGTEGANNDVDHVSQTWWHILAAENNLIVDTNNSYSGATICTGDNGASFTGSFIQRMREVGTPDILFVEGGTNDQGQGVTIGTPKYSEWSNLDLQEYAPALCYILDYYTLRYPHAKIIFLMNGSLNDSIKSVTEEICTHYNVEYLVLDVEKQNGHPSVNGMRSIANLIKEHI